MVMDPNPPPGSPLWFLSKSDHEAGIENPTYTASELQDQLLVSLSSSELTHEIGGRNSWEHWENIHNHFHAKMKA